MEITGSSVESKCPDATNPAQLTGTARLSVVMVTALITFFQQGLLFYALPLYFSAKGLPSSAWETWGLYLIIAWLFAPLVNWILARHIGERRIWALGLVFDALIIAWLIVLPVGLLGADFAVGVAALLYGVAGALLWISVMTLVQNVPAVRRGRSNSLLMISLGLGSIAGPLFGRWTLAIQGNLGHTSLAGFYVMLSAGVILSLLGGVIIYLWGEYPRDIQKPIVTSSAPTLRDDFRLARSASFLALVIPLSLLTGPTFQATNVYLAYRAAEPGIGLIQNSQDHGWMALQVTSYVMQLLGGLLLGCVAGKRVSFRVAAALLGAFGFCGIGIGLAPDAIVLFICVALFEMGRQFARWLQTGYVSEHVSAEQRSAAISVSVLLSGVGATGFMLLLRVVQSPDASSFSSALPFLIAGVFSAVGVLILVVGGRLTAKAKSMPER